MRKIIVGAQVSMDGVMQAPSGPTEDPTKGFKFGGWSNTISIRSSARKLTAFSARDSISCSAARPSDFRGVLAVLRRRRSPWRDREAFSRESRSAVSRSGGVDTSWQGSVLLRDIADVKRLRDEEGPNLVTQGSTELVHVLLANDLVDAMTIFTVPVVLGGGKKLFADGSMPHAYKLTRSRVSTTGVMIGHYDRGGQIEIGGTELDSPSEREIARQARMKREG